MERNKCIAKTAAIASIRHGPMEADRIISNGLMKWCREISLIKSGDPNTKGLLEKIFSCFYCGV